MSHCDCDTTTSVEGSPDPAYSSEWYCDCTESNIRRADSKHPHVAISREGWFCMRCLNEFVMKEEN